MSIFARTALVGAEWIRDVRVTLDGGRIGTLVAGARADAGDVAVDVLLPAPGNLHSHAFQRAMAGMTEARSEGRESFWTWRELMYRFLDHLTPDHVEAIAALVYVEMLEAGFGSVAEFHYLHHGPGGEPYAALGEMSARIYAAADATGIGLTHLPVLYARGGMADEPLAGGQRRFGNGVERFLALAEDCQGMLAGAPEDWALGVAPHSLRAVSPGDLAALLEAFQAGPVHIHAAEQVAEVEAVEAALGARPVRWLLDEAGADGRWCLIHATQMDAGEVRDLARSGAVAGLCPVTEANLGDGIFEGPGYFAGGGRFGVGSDSNVRISLAEELRGLEYSQRLRDRERAVLAGDAGSVGTRLLAGAAAGASRAMGRDAGRIGEGAVADLVALDREDPALCALRDDQLADGFVFAAGPGVVREVWSAGRHVVRDGRHVAREAVVAAYRRAVTDLVGRI